MKLIKWIGGVISYIIVSIMALLFIPLAILFILYLFFSVGPKTGLETFKITWKQIFGKNKEDGK